MIQNFFDTIRVYDVGLTKVRLGNKGDGGYVVLDEVCKNSSRLYSYGVGNDISFEEDFYHRYSGNKIRLFDHTVDGINTNNKDFHFVQEGLSYKKLSHFNTLENHIRQFGDENVPHKNLKIDIEWNEWKVFEELSDKTLRSFDQIICEFHTIPVQYKDSHSPYFTEFHKQVYAQINNLMFARYTKVMDKILNWYCIFHAHINNSLPLVEVNGLKIPSLVELSLVNRQSITMARLPAKSRFPQDGLDYPNKTDRDDIEWNNG
jgi:hypothetical protein